ncbi:hypothetical protein ONZ45_g2430 [Pleurotus djamor]|nr:hypothetical protein ONZ45_g2430 [Pleurotus djamor]
MKFFILLGLVSITYTLAKPANDWSKPCFNGECAYDMPESTGHSGVLHMSGKAITDVTPAAGWVILDCDPHSMDQEIRLVCTSEDHEAAGCSHLFNGGGPVDKVVRLPESCTPAPFLRVAAASVAEDQSIPSHALRKVSKRDGRTPTVHVLKVDTNWEAADVSKTGVVNFAFTGANAPSVDEQPSAQQHTLVARGFFSWLKDTWNKVKTWVVNATTAAVRKLKELTGFSINPETIKRARVTLHNETIFELDAKHKPNCEKENGVSANVKITGDGFLIATIKLGLLANGSIIPPTIGSFAIYTIVDADVDLRIIATASITGHIETPRKKLVHHDVTPLQIPGIIALGPAVEVEAQAELDLGLEVTLDTTLRYKIDELEYWYPRKITQDIPDIKAGSKAVSSEPSCLSVGAGKATLGAYVEADIWARARLKGEVSTKVKRDGDVSLHSRPARYVPPYSLEAIEARETNIEDIPLKFKGCIGFFGGVVLRAGAKGEIGKYKAETQPWDIYKTPELLIYEKCWEGATGSHKRRSLPALSSLEKRAKIEVSKCGPSPPVSVGKSNTPKKALQGKPTEQHHAHHNIVSDGSDE